MQDILTKYDPAKIINCLADIDWTTIDAVRIGTQHSTSDPIILWVGVVPGSLSWQRGVEVTYCCRSVLLKAGLDIHCEIRESIVKRTAATKPLHLQGTFTLGDHRVVGKYGSSTELTWGVSHEIQSIGRIGKGFILHGVVVTLDKRNVFSQQGDSGSAIFDLDGQVGGILYAGSGSYYEALDLTYITPMEWIIKDIEAKVGPVAFL